MTIGLLGLAVALAVGSVALYVALSVASRHDLDRRAEATAAQVAELVTCGRLPDPIPVTGTESVQVVDARNRVLSASANGDRLTPLLTPRRAGAGAATSPVTVSGSRLGMSSTLRVSATPPRRPRPGRRPWWWPSRCPTSPGASTSWWSPCW